MISGFSTNTFSQFPSAHAFLIFLNILDRPNNSPAIEEVTIGIIYNISLFLSISLICSNLCWKMKLDV